MTDQTNNKAKVFDIPTRFFHWIFALLFVCAFSIAKFTDDDAALYPYHMLMGFMMVFAIFLRAIWGIIGTKYARFSSFSLNPLKLIEYFASILRGNKRPTINRNPASSFAAITMFAISIALGISGYLMATATTEQKMHDIKEIHEILATLFLIIALLHILGIIIHTITQKDPIGLSMINGTKAAHNGENGITNNYSWVGALFIAIMGLGGFAMAQNYDATTKTLKIAGQTLQLGENEGAEGKDAKGEKDKGEDKEAEEEENDED